MSLEFWVYQEAGATRTMRNLPRFGHSNNFAHLFGSDDQRRDYVYGLLIAGIFIIGLFSAWAAVLLVLKCFGKRRIGYLSGAAMEVDSMNAKDRGRPLLVRITFLISCIMVITFAVLVVTKGLTNIYNTVDTVHESAVAINQLSADAHTAVTNLQSLGVTASLIRANLIDLVTPSFCPNRPELEEETGIPFSRIINLTIDVLQELSDFVDADFEELEESLNNTQREASNVEEVTQNIDINDVQSLIIIIPYMSLCFFMLVGLALAWRGISVRWYQCLLSWFFLPLFIIMVGASYLSSGVIAIIASGNADWCSGGNERTPDGSIEEILRLNGLDESDMQFRIIKHYASQCTRSDPFNFAKALANNATEAAVQVLDFELGIQNATGVIDDLSDYCGQDYSPLYSTVLLMQEQLNLLIESIDSLLDVLSCERIVPIYVNTVYGASCKYSVNGVTWAFTGFLVVAVFGMLMIMFRTAYLPDKDVSDLDCLEKCNDDDHDDDVSSQDETYVHDTDDSDLDYLEKHNDEASSEEAEYIQDDQGEGYEVEHGEKHEEEYEDENEDVVEYQEDDCKDDEEGANASKVIGSPKVDEAPSTANENMPVETFLYTYEF